jgi:hypothetical protein
MIVLSIASQIGVERWWPRESPPGRDVGGVIGLARNAVATAAAFAAKIRPQAATMGRAVSAWRRSSVHFEHLIRLIGNLSDQVVTLTT